VPVQQGLRLTLKALHLRAPSWGRPSAFDESSPCRTVRPLVANAETSDGDVREFVPEHLAERTAGDDGARDRDAGTPQVRASERTDQPRADADFDITELDPPEFHQPLDLGTDQWTQISRGVSAPFELHPSQGFLSRY
jgi:hypothetical protein